MALRNRLHGQRAVWGLAYGSTSATRLVRGRETRAQHAICRAQHASFTLVEMLVAMAITLVMMGAVVTLFANVSASVRNRRATAEMSGQIRGVRNVLQQDLQGATCPGLTWQRPESNHGYIELIEGQYKEGNPSNLVDGVTDSAKFNPEIDHATSILPSSNLPFASVTGQGDWATDGQGLGDYDDILMLTVRNEHQPFVGRMPSIGDKQPYAKWDSESVESPLAEVVWFAIENPESDSSANHFFGEPGMRTIYRRTLLIAPWLNPYKALDKDGDGLVQDPASGTVFKAVPGLLRRLPAKIDVTEAIAALISFQDRYDVSCRIEWDYNIGQWEIVANTLGDLTKRENRFCHYGFLVNSDPKKWQRVYPFPLVSVGSGYSGITQDVVFVLDPEVGGSNNAKNVKANILNSATASYTNDPQNYKDASRRYTARPFAYIDKAPSGVPITPATAQVMLNEDGAIVRVLHGPVPLWGPRRGEDVMLTDVLAFDLRVFDPGAPLFATRKKPNDPINTDLDVVLTPSDPGWTIAYTSSDNMGGGAIGKNNSKPTSLVYPFVGQGAYVDLGYGFNLPYPAYLSPDFSSSAAPWFFTPRALSDVYGNQLAPGYAVYDTWSFHYENDGIDEDGDGIIDQGTDGLDGVGRYANPNPPPLTINDTRLGVDDVGERETVPPYDKPLRGVQVLIRAYERDSRAIRQVRVNQHFMPE